MLKLIDSRPSVIYGSCKVNIGSVDNYSPFRPIFSALNSPAYKPEKFLAPVLKPSTSNKSTITDYFHFTEEIVDQ